MVNNSHGYVDPTIKFDEELIKVGYSDIKIDFNIAEPLDKTMGAVFGYPLTTDYDYSIYKNEVKPTTPVVNPEKPGLATLFKQTILTIGDILGFLFKIVKQAIDQIVNSFIMPILTPALPYTLPILIQKIIEIIKKILDMVNEAISIVTDTLNWILKKVAGKLMKIKIPIPKFSIPLFGLAIAIPAIDILGISKTEPYASLPSDKIKNITKKISGLNKELSLVPVNDLDMKKDIKSQIDSAQKDIDRLSKIKDIDVTNKFNEVQDINYQINEINDSKSQNNKDFLTNALGVMEVSLSVLKSMLYMSTLDISDLVIGIHNDIILKKKVILDEFLTKQIQDGKGIKIQAGTLDSITSELNSQGIYFSDAIKDGLRLGVTPGNSSDMNSSINYIIDTTSSTLGLITTYNVNFLSYTFTDRLSIYQKENNYLNDNKIQVKEFKVGSKTRYLYGFNGDYHYLRTSAGFLIDEIEKEELDLEEDINKYKIENIPSYAQRIQALNDLLDKPSTKQLKTSEQYRTPILSDVEREGYKRIGQEAPKEDVLVTELVIDGYRERLVNQKNNVDTILEQITILEDAITQFKKRINDAKIKGSDNTDNESDKNKLDSLKQLKTEKEAELNKLSPEAASSSKLIQLLISLLVFPMQMIIGLLGKLLGGIVDFITGLPLLKFDKIISFFSALFKIPTKDGIGDLMKVALDLPTAAAAAEEAAKAATSVTSPATVSSIVPSHLINPVSKIVDGASESVSTMGYGFVDEAVKPYSPFSLAELPDIKREPTIPLEAYTGEYEAEQITYPDGSENTSDTIYNGDGSIAYKSASLSSLHPSIRQYGITTYNDLNALLKSNYGGSHLGVNLVYRNYAYQEELYKRWQNKDPNVLKAAKPGTSYHEAGLAMDINVYRGDGSKIGKDSTNEEVFQYAKNYLENRGWKWFGVGDYVHFDYRVGVTKRPFQLLSSGNNTPPDDKGRIYPVLS